MATLVELDRKDRELLSLLQRDCRQSQAALAAQLNLSESSVRRRIDVLRANGVIAREVALLAPERVPGITVIVQVMFERESLEATTRFRQRMRALAEVQQCYSVSGAVDFVLLVRAADLASYEQWGQRELMADPAIRRYDSLVVWSTVKFETALALGE